MIIFMYLALYYDVTIQVITGYSKNHKRIIYPHSYENFLIMLFFHHTGYRCVSRSRILFSEGAVPVLRTMSCVIVIGQFSEALVGCSLPINVHMFLNVARLQAKNCNGLSLTYR